MKNKLSAIIIVIAIWFGVADVMKNFGLLKSEADQLIAKSSLYLLALGSDGSSDYVKEKSGAKREALIADSKQSIEDDMACEAIPVARERINLIAKGMRATQQMLSSANHAQISLDQDAAENAQSQTDAASREHPKEAARVMVFDIERFSKEAISVSNEARMVDERAFKIHHRAPLPNTFVSPKLIESFREKINYEFSNGYDDNDADASNKGKLVSVIFCPKKTSNERRLKKLVVLLPDILQKVGE